MPWRPAESSVPGRGERRSSSAAIAAFGHGAFDAALDRLMMQPERPSYRKRRVFPIGQNIRTRSTRIAGSVRECPIDSTSPTARRHAAMIYTALHIPHYDNFHGIGRLGTFRGPGNPIRRC